MTLEEKIKNIAGEYDLGDPEFTVDIRKNYIRINEATWNINRPENPSYLEDIVFENINRRYDMENNEWVLGYDHMINNIKYSIRNYARQMFMKTSPAKAPRRTKVYKSFVSTVNNSDNMELYSNLADIADYYKKSTKDTGIQSETNAVARKNIFQLLCLMEKKYGKKEKTRN